MYKDSTERLAELFASVIARLDPEPNRPGLAETPMRAAEAFIHYTKGYYEVPADHIKIFDEPRTDCEVSVRDIPFYSMCEHHLAPFFGTATISYRPRGNRVVGLSKLARLLDAHSRRLQVQERITYDVAADILAVLKPAHVSVELTATHMCMCARGVGAHGATTVTKTVLMGSL